MQQEGPPENVTKPWRMLTAKLSRREATQRLSARLKRLVSC